MSIIDYFEIANISLLILLVTTALFVILVRNLLASIIMLGVFSLLMAAEYLVLGAPDVAITEAAIGACMSGVLILSCLLLVGEKEKKSKHPIFPLLVIGTTGLALIYGMSGLPVFGDANAVANKQIVPHYLQNSPNETGIPNVVTSILASYRGFDTLFETVVIFTAGISVFLLLKRDR